MKYLVWLQEDDYVPEVIYEGDKDGAEEAWDVAVGDVDDYVNNDSLDVWIEVVS